MSQFLKKLKPFLNKDFNSYSSSLETYFTNLGKGQFVYPINLSIKAKVPTDLANKLLLHMLREGLLNHYSIPEYNEEPLEEFAKIGFNWIASEEDENSLENENIPLDEIRVITGYKVKEAGLE